MATQSLIVIVGPTASGKSALAMELAKKYNGEIICADSRTIYKGMDIGTAKPTKEDQAAVRHWGLDMVEPGEQFSAADFKQYAEIKIQEIRQRGKVPFLVGGTGLYVDGVLFNYEFGEKSDVNQRSELEKLTLSELQEYCSKNNIILPDNDMNKRYVIRAIEQNGVNQRRNILPVKNSHVVGISTDKEKLRTKIENRIEQLFESGVVEEAKILGKKYGWDTPAMTGNIYPILHNYLSGQITLAQAKEKSVTQDWRLAKRQLTWLKRNEHIKWLPPEEAFDYLSTVLASEQ